MGDLKFENHVEKDTVLTPSKEVEKTLASNGYLSVYEIGAYFGFIVAQTKRTICSEGLLSGGPAEVC